MLLLAWNLNTWHIMTDANKAVSFKEISKFLKECPNWPHQDKVIAKGEKCIDDSIGHKVALMWFKRHPPQSIQAWHMFIKLLSHDEKIGAMRQVWQENIMSANEQKEWFKKYKDHLNDKSNQRRLDFLFIQGATNLIADMIDLIPKFKEQAEFRQRLLAQEAGLELPKNATRGMVLSYIKYARLSDDFDACASILKKFKHDQNTFANEWAYERMRVAKELVQQKRYLEAYDILDGCSLRPSALKNDVLIFKVELGYYLLEYRKKLLPDLLELYEHGSLANTKSFAAYYLGVIKNDKEWLKKAATHSTTFFGLKAIDVLKGPSPRFITAKAFKKSNDLIRTLFSLDGQDQGLTVQFILAVVKRDINDYEQGVAFTQAVHKKFGPPFTFWADGAVQKKFARTPKMKILYPTLPQIKKPLYLALIKQESLFDKNARSAADAMGYMQLIQKTAERFAGRSVTEKEIFNPVNNLKWGVAYLEQLDKDYEGCFPLILSAYNAGEHRVERWLSLYGDPRHDISVEHFVALIPFKETKHYVMKILANKRIYEEILKTS